MKIYKLIPFLLLFAFLMPLSVSAHNIPIPYFPGAGNQPSLLTCSVSINAAGNVGNNCSFCELVHTLQHFIYFGITLVVFVFSPILLLYGGFMILIAGGSPERVSTGKKILTGTLVGFFLAVGAFLIVNTFFWAVGANLGQGIGQVSWPKINC